MEIQGLDLATILSYGILFSLYQIVTDTKKKTDVVNLKLTKHKCKLDQIKKKSTCNHF